MYEMSTDASKPNESATVSDAISFCASGRSGGHISLITNKLSNQEGKQNLKRN